MPPTTATPIPTVNRPTATSPAATTPRTRDSSTRWPTRPSRAGSRVTEASMVTATVEAAPMPSPEMNLRPMSSMPRSDTTTVRPAKTTARPAVSMARPTESSGERPAAMAPR